MASPGDGRMGTNTPSGSGASGSLDLAPDLHQQRQFSTASTLTDARLTSSSAPASSSSAAAAATAKNPHCSFVMLAEFDIDKGSTLTHVWPDRRVISGHDDHHLAELMLPDGAHTRSEDWTTFFLASAGPTSPVSSNPAAATLSSSGSSSSTSSGLTYVINLVRTKHDSTVRRGALVKALAIGSRHPCLHIFKPALILALDDYFSSPGPSSLAHLYQAINAMDLSSKPSFTRAEKLILRASDRKDLFLERFSNSCDVAVQGSLPSSSNGEPDSASSTRQPVVPPSSARVARKQSAASLRGAMMSTRMTSQSSIGPASPNSALPASPSGGPSLVANRDTHYWDTILHYAQIDVPIRWPVDVFDDEVGEYSLSSLFQTFSSQPVSGPVHSQLHSNGAQTHPILVLFNAIVTYKRVVFLGHNLPAATVAGHVLAAAALGSGCGAILPGVKERTSPYANLIALDTLEKTPGYIAGVTNPRFEELRCWDVLCTIETGRIVVHKDIETAPRLALTRSIAPSMANTALTSGITSTNGSFGMSNHNPSLSGDAASASDVSMSWSDGPTGSTAASARNRGGSTLGKSRGAAILGEFGSVTAAGIGSAMESRQDLADSAFMEELHSALHARCSESYVRSRVIEYVSTFVRHLTRHEEHYYGASLANSRRFPHQPYLNGQIGSGTAFGDREGEGREIEANAHRLEGFRSSGGYKTWSEFDAICLSETQMPDMDVWHQICRLRGRGKPMHSAEAELVFSSLVENASSDDQIVELLSFLPPHSGGLSPLTLGLYHSSSSVRLNACKLLSRIASHRSAGLQAIQSLPLFHRLALARIRGERQEEVLLRSRGDDRRENVTGGAAVSVPMTPSDSKPGVNKSNAAGRRGIDSSAGSASTSPPRAPRPDYGSMFPGADSFNGQIPARQRGSDGTSSGGGFESGRGGASSMTTMNEAPRIPLLASTTNE